MPNGGNGITAWCVIDEELSPDELISVDMPLQPTGNRAGDAYASRWSDGDNVVNATIYVVERTISGRVFVDMNGNDAYDDGEQLVRDAVVKIIDADGDVVTNLEGDACETVTGSDGAYSFTALPAGDMYVLFEPKDGDGWQYMSVVEQNADGVDDAIDSDAAPNFDGDGALASATIGIINMPDVTKMASTVYSSEHNDLGIRSNGHAEIAVEKTATIEHQLFCDVGDGTSDGVDEAHVGDTIRYSIVVTNVGDVDVSNVSIDDALLGIEGLVIVDALPVGDSIAYKDGTHVVTVDDIRSGTVLNEVTAHAEPPAHVAFPTDVSDDVETPTIANPSIEIRKSTDIALIEDAKPGDEIPYEFTVENTGDVPLSDIAATDALDAIGDIELDRTELSPGEIATGTAAYAITQNDIDAGHVINTASVIGTGIDEGDTTDMSDEIETALAQSPALSLTKDVDIDEIAPASAGDELTYLFTVTNTGNVTLSDVGIDDELEGLSDIAFDWGASTDAATGDGVLSVGETVEATATYGVTQDDIDAGEVVNVATAHGLMLSGEDVESNEDDAVTVLRVPAEKAINNGGDDRDAAVVVNEPEGNANGENVSDDSHDVASDIASTGVSNGTVVFALGILASIAGIAGAVSIIRRTR